MNSPEGAFQLFSSPRLRKHQLGLSTRAAASDTEHMLNPLEHAESSSSSSSSDGAPASKPARHDHGSDNEAGMWYDLFFDLTFVVIIASLAKMAERILEEDLTAAANAINNNSTAPYPFGLSQDGNGWFCYFLYAWMAYQMWSRETVVVARIVGGNDVIGRIRGFAFLLCVCGFAGNLPTGEHDRVSITPWALRFYAMSCAMPVLLMLRIMCHNVAYRTNWPGLLIAGAHISCMLGYSFITEEGGRALTVLIHELLSTMVYIRFSIKQSQHYNPHYMSERFGVLTLVILGETVASTVVASQQTTFFNTALLLGCVFSFWAIYFDNVSDAAVFNHSTRTIYVWLLHWLLWTANTAFAACAVVLIERDHHDAVITRYLVWATIVSFSGVVVAQNAMRWVYRWSKEALHDHCRYFILKLIITGVFVLVPPMLVPVFIQVWTCSGVLGLCFGVSMVRVILDAMLNSRLRGLSIEKEAACAELAPGRARARLACGERGNASASEGGAAAAEEEGKNKREAV